MYFPTDSASYENKIDASTLSETKQVSQFQKFSKSRFFSVPKDFLDLTYFSVTESRFLNRGKLDCPIK